MIALLRRQRVESRILSPRECEVTKSWQISAVRCTALSRVFRLSQGSTGEHNMDVFLCRTRAAK